MASPLDGIEEKHEGPEPRVLTEDVQVILRRRIKPTNEESGSTSSVATIAEKADVSTRTVYRVLQGDPDKPTIGLDLADRLVLAAGAHLSACRLVWPSGNVTPYF